MYPNLMGMKAFHGLTSDDMGRYLRYQPKLPMNPK